MYLHTGQLSLPQPMRWVYFAFKSAYSAAFRQTTPRAVVIGDKCISSPLLSLSI